MLLYILYMFLMSPDIGPTNLVSNNFEIFTLLKDDFCSVRLLYSRMLKESPSSRSHASSLYMACLHQGALAY